MIAHLEFSVWFLTVRGPYVRIPDHDGTPSASSQYVGGADVDGVHWRTDVSVGRAPVQSGAQTATFVDKVIADETYGNRILTRPAGDDWASRVLIAAENWGGPITISRATAHPPRDNRFRPGPDVTLIKLADVPSSFQLQLIAHVSDSDRRKLPYATSGHGWCYVRSAGDLTSNTIPIPFLPDFPWPSAWIAVRGPAAVLDPVRYEFDHTGQDGSMQDQEQLRVQLRPELPVGATCRGSTRTRWI